MVLLNLLSLWRTQTNALATLNRLDTLSVQSSVRTSAPRQNVSVSRSFNLTSIRTFVVRSVGRSVILTVVRVFGTHMKLFNALSVLFAGFCVTAGFRLIFSRCRFFFNVLD